MIVKSLEHFKILATSENDDFQDFHILLANGLARSSKRILYDQESDAFSIINEIDESYQEIHSDEVEKSTNIITAINAGVFFKG